MDTTPLFDLLSIGECLVEFSQQPSGQFRPAFAGDTANTLFYGARLGLRTGFISAVGDDLFTEMIVSGLESERIDITHTLRLPGRRNGLYFIELDETGEHHFHYWRHDSAATETLLHYSTERLAKFVSSSRMLLVSGITLAVMKEPARLIALLEAVRDTVTVVLDTNYRPRLWSSPEEYHRRIGQIIPHVDILLPSQADLEAAWQGVAIENLLWHFAEQGVGTICMKAGGNGCALWDDGILEWFAPPNDVRVVDATGAGDAFNAGFITGVVQGRSKEESCALAQQTASHALTVHGALNQEFGAGGA
ncbi:MAG: sugar kinase [Armatimonadetes bacterium]|nr:sugar kinase [Armatimonadota bacterium]